MKPKKYWLRGGLIGIAALFLIVLFLVIAILIAGDGGLTSCGDMGCPYSWLILMLIVGVLPFFLMGLFVGWIYGKIKNRTKIV